LSYAADKHTDKQTNRRTQTSYPECQRVKSKIFSRSSRVLVSVHCVFRYYSLIIRVIFCLGLKHVQFTCAICCCSVQTTPLTNKGSCCYCYTAILLLYIYTTSSTTPRHTTTTACLLEVVRRSDEDAVLLCSVTSEMTSKTEVEHKLCCMWDSTSPLG